MSSFQPFVQTDVTHITVEGAVLVDSERKIGASLSRYLFEHNMIRWGNKSLTHTEKRCILLLDKLEQLVSRKLDTFEETKTNILSDSHSLLRSN